MKYFVTYNWSNPSRSSFGYGNAQIETEPICGFEDIKRLEGELLKDDPSLVKLVITGWQRFEEPEPEAAFVSALEQAHRQHAPAPDPRLVRAVEMIKMLAESLEPASNENSQGARMVVAIAKNAKALLKEIGPV